MFVLFSVFIWRFSPTATVIIENNVGYCVHAVSAVILRRTRVVHCEVI